MPDITPNMEHMQLEQDIDRLAGEVSRLREQPETQGADRREVVKEALSNVTGRAPQQQTDDDTASQSSDKGRIRSPLPAYAEDLSPEIKLEVESLIDYALHKGVVAAAKEAEKTSGMVEDIFHDAMAGKYHDILKERGFFKE